MIKFEKENIMSAEEKFEYDINNIKKDFEMENMIVTDEDIALLKRYLNKEITKQEMIDIILKESEYIN